ncbi:MAG: hypothetical protein V3S64_00100 [bacterium]
MKPFHPPRNLPVRLVELGATPPAESQAVYHALAEAMTPEQPDTVVLTRPASAYLCLGYHQVFESVLDAGVCRRRGLPVLRRRVGGGATYLDADQLFYQFIFHHSRVPANFRRTYQYLLGGPVAALNTLGLAARLHELNEVEVGEARVAGVGGGQIGEACVVVGNYLLDFDYGAMTEVWAAPWPSFRELAGNALRAHVSGLRRLKPGLDEAALNARLKEALPAALGRPLQPGALTDREKELARNIGERLGGKAYLGLHRERGTAPMRSLKVSARAHIHGVEGRSDGTPLQASLFLFEQHVREARVMEAPGGARMHQLETRLQGMDLPAARDLLEE